MAPVHTEIQDVEQNVQEVLQSLFQMMVQVANYDTMGKPSREVLAQEMQKYSQYLSQVHSSALALDWGAHGPRVPEPLVQYVENGRNPDIYTREFVELVRRMNQLARGKTAAFASFRDVLAHELCAANPELADDVRRVVDMTGGPRLPIRSRPKEGAGAGVAQETGQQQAQGQQGTTASEAVPPPAAP